MFHDRLQHARQGAKPGEPAPRRPLARLGRALDASEVAEAIALLDDLGRRRDELVANPLATAEEAETVWAEQKDVSVVLGHVPRRHRGAVVLALASPSRHVRFFAAGALLTAADPRTVLSMTAVRDVERDDDVREVLTRAIEIAGGRRLAWGRGQRAK